MKAVGDLFAHNIADAAKMELTLVTENDTRMMDVIKKFDSPKIVVPDTAGLSGTTLLNVQTGQQEMFPVINWGDAGWSCVDNSMENNSRKEFKQSFAEGSGDSSDTFWMFEHWMVRGRADRALAETVPGICGKHSLADMHKRGLLARRPRPFATDGPFSRIQSQPMTPEPTDSSDSDGDDYKADNHQVVLLALKEGHHSVSAVLHCPSMISLPVRRPRIFYHTLDELVYGKRNGLSDYSLKVQIAACETACRKAASRGLSFTGRYIGKVELVDFLLVDDDRRLEAIFYEAQKKRRTKNGVKAAIADYNEDGHQDCMHALLDTLAQSPYVSIACSTSSHLAHIRDELL